MTISEKEFFTEDFVLQRQPVSHKLEKKLLLDLGIRVLEFGILLLIGVIFIFWLLQKLPVGPWDYLPWFYYTDESFLQLIASEQEKWGYNDPILTQFFLYLKNIIRGDFGYSLVVKKGVAVNTLIAQNWSKSVQLVFISFLFAIMPSVGLGIVSANRKGTWADRIILAVAGVCFVLSLSGIGLVFQYLFSMKLDLFPATLFQSPDYIGYDPNITGYVLIDSLLKGEGEVFVDVLKHLILPGFVISFGFIAMGILVIRRLVIIYKTKKLNLPKRNYLRVSLAFFSITLILGQTESIFQIYGMNLLGLIALTSLDYFLIMGILLKIFLTFHLLAFIIDVIGILVQFIFDKKYPEQNTLEKNIPASLPEPKLSFKNESYNSEMLLNPSSQHDEFMEKPTLKSILLRPGVIIGGVLLAGCFIISIIAFFSYDLQSLNMDSEALDWAPPSSDHPWGTAKFGRDVMGRSLYGFVFPLLYLLPLVLVVSAIGIVAGLFMSFKNSVLDDGFDFIGKILIILPCIILQIHLTRVYDPSSTTFIIIFCLNALIFSIMIGHRILSKKDRNLFIWGSKTPYVIHAIPQILTGTFLMGCLSVFALNILVFFGYSTPELIIWGNDVYYARSHIYGAPWATIYPISASILLGLSLILITASLYGYVSKRDQLQTIDPSIA